MPYCECGNERERGAEACPRCLALDGHTISEAQTIDALRALGGIATAEALVTELGLHPRKVEIYLGRLARRGRVLRLMTGEEDSPHQPLWLLSDTPRGMQLRLRFPSLWFEVCETTAGCRRRVLRRCHGWSQLLLRWPVRRCRRSVSRRIAGPTPFARSAGHGA